MNLYPPAQGLYDPRHEHDACGVGFICQMKGVASHQLVSDALQMLENMNQTRAREVVAFISKHTNGNLPVIGVGGILTPDDALRMFDAGAALIQLLTGLIYHGPGLIRKINRAVR